MDKILRALITVVNIAITSSSIPDTLYTHHKSAGPTVYRPCDLPRRNDTGYMVMCQIVYHQQWYLCDPGSKWSRTEAMLLNDVIGYNFTACCPPNFRNFNNTCLSRVPPNAKSAQRTYAALNDQFSSIRVLHEATNDHRFRFMLYVVPLATFKRWSSPNNNDKNDAKQSSCPISRAAASTEYGELLFRADLYAKHLIGHVTAGCAVDWLHVVIIDWADRDKEMYNKPWAVMTPVFRNRLEGLNAYRTINTATPLRQPNEMFNQVVDYARRLISILQGQLAVPGTSHCLDERLLPIDCNASRDQHNDAHHIPLWAVAVSAALLTYIPGLAAVSVCIANLVTTHLFVPGQHRNTIITSATAQRRANQRTTQKHWKAGFGGGMLMSNMTDQRHNGAVPTSSTGNRRMAGMMFSALKAKDNNPSNAPNVNYV